MAPSLPVSKKLTDFQTDCIHSLPITKRDESRTVSREVCQIRYADIPADEKYIAFTDLTKAHPRETWHFLTNFWPVKETPICDDWGAERALSSEGLIHEYFLNLHHELKTQSFHSLWEWRLAIQEGVFAMDYFLICANSNRTTPGPGIRAIHNALKIFYSDSRELMNPSNPKGGSPLFDSDGDMPSLGTPAERDQAFDHKDHFPLERYCFKDQDNDLLCDHLDADMSDIQVWTKWRVGQTIQTDRMRITRVSDSHFRIATIILVEGSPEEITEEFLKEAEKKIRRTFPETILPGKFTSDLEVTLSRKEGYFKVNLSPNVNSRGNALNWTKHMFQNPRVLIHELAHLLFERPDYYFEFRDGKAGYRIYFSARPGYEVLGRDHIQKTSSTGSLPQRDLVNILSNLYIQNHGRGIHPPVLLDRNQLLNGANRPPYY